jgi:glycosyltransferase involved in cell wall biosynthesis
MLINLYKQIYIFSQSLNSGGAEKQAVLLAKIFSNSCKVTFIIYYENKINNVLFELLKSNNVQIIILRGTFIQKFYNLISILRKSNNSILFNYLLLPNLLGALSAKIVGVKSIGGIRSSILDKKKNPFNRLAHNLLNTKTVYNNYSGYEKYTSQGFIKHKALVIPNAIIIKQKQISRQEKEVPNILSVGRFEEVKDYHSALKAIKGLFESDIKFTYTIVGWGTLEEQLYQWISELNIPKNVVSIIINPLQIESYYMEADIYLQTSLFEGLSNTILEAMSYSLPLVVTNVGDNTRLVKNDYNGFLVSPKDIVSIEKNLKVLLSDHTLRINFGKASYDSVCENYSIGNMKRKYLELIENLVNG